MLKIEKNASKSYREDHLSSGSDNGDAVEAQSSSDLSSYGSPISADVESKITRLEKLSIPESSADKVVQTSRESLPSQNPFSLKRKLPATGTDGAVPQKGREINQVDLDCGSPVSKRRKKIDISTYRLGNFVESFVRGFEDELRNYYNEVGKKKKAKLPALLSPKSGKIGLIGGSLATGVATGIALSGISVLGVVMIAGAAVTFGNYIDHFTTKIAGFSRKRKAAKVANAGCNSAVDGFQIREVLVKAGVDIFLHYEHQYTDVQYTRTPALTMGLLAQDAVGRVMNYLKSREDDTQVEDPEAFLKNFHTLITEGIVLGNSKKNKSVFTLKKTEEKLNIEDMYAQVGLVRIIDTDGGEANEYYTKESETNVEKYGYRAMFEWELGNVSGGWKKQENPSQIQYKYALNPEEIEEEASKILEKINGKEPVVRRDIAKLENDFTNTDKKINLLLARKQGLEVSIFDCPLQLAVKENDLKMVQYLIERKDVNYNVKNLYEGHDLFQLAAENDSLEVFKYLRKVCGQCFDYEIKDQFQYNLPQLAAINDSLKVLKYLIDEKLFDYKVVADFGYNLLQLAAMSGSIEVFKYLIYRKYFDYKMVDEEGNDLFRYAVQCDSLEVLEYLIGKDEKYFNYSIKNDAGYSLLRLATENDSIKVLTYLIKKRNLNYQLKDDRGYNLLHVAVENDSVNVLTYLRDQNCNYELKKDGGIIFSAHLLKMIQ